MTLDEDGFPLTYWRVTGLVENSDSAVLTFKITTPVSNGFLTSTSDSRVNVWARRKGIAASYQNIETTPIDLSAMPAQDTEFELYIEALGPIPDGAEVVSLYVAPASNQPAGWEN